MIERGSLAEDRSGQFYLIAAIIIATVLVGIVSITNYSKREPGTGLSDLKEELEIEGLPLPGESIPEYLSRMNVREESIPEAS